MCKLVEDDSWGFYLTENVLIGEIFGKVVGIKRTTYAEDHYEVYSLDSEGYPRSQWVAESYITKTNKH